MNFEHIFQDWLLDLTIMTTHNQRLTTLGILPQKSRSFTIESLQQKSPYEVFTKIPLETGQILLVNEQKWQVIETPITLNQTSLQAEIFHKAYVKPI